MRVLEVQWSWALTLVCEVAFTFQIQRRETLEMFVRSMGLFYDLLSNDAMQRLVPYQEDRVGKK
jgi:hypothetical protein